MSIIQNIDSHIILDVAECIERLIADARAHIGRTVNITEVVTNMRLGVLLLRLCRKVRSARHTASSY